MAAHRTSPSAPHTALAPTLDDSVPESSSETLPTAVVVTAEAAGEPSRIGRYLIIRRLGQGGMGVVYLAYDAELDRRVAIKLVRHGQAPTSIGRARIKQEAQTMAKVAHPNIVHVYEVGESSGQLFIVMEYVAGIRLSDWQAQRDTGVAAIQQTLRVYLQAAAGLAAAHQAGLVHRDFKPERVPLVEKPRLAFPAEGQKGECPPSHRGSRTPLPRWAFPPLL